MVVGASGAIGEADECVAEFITFQDVDLDDVPVGGECAGEVLFASEEFGFHPESGQTVGLVAMGGEE